MVTPESCGIVFFSPAAKSFGTPQFRLPTFYPHRNQALGSADIITTDGHKQASTGVPPLAASYAPTPALGGFTDSSGTGRRREMKPSVMTSPAVYRRSFAGQKGCPRKPDDPTAGKNTWTVSPYPSYCHPKTPISVKLRCTRCLLRPPPPESPQLLAAFPYFKSLHSSFGLERVGQCGHQERHGLRAPSPRRFCSPRRAPPPFPRRRNPEGSGPDKRFPPKTTPVARAGRRRAHTG